MIDTTKPLIAEAMKTLMRKKSIDKIRISEICQAVGIERSTFYYHFNDKYTLVAWIFLRSARNVKINDISSSAAHMKQMKGDILFYKRAFEYTAQNALWQYMLEYFVEENTKAIKEILQVDTLSSDLSYCIRYYCYGAVGMTREWIMLEDSTPAETFVKRVYECMPTVLQQIFTNNK